MSEVGSEMGSGLFRPPQNPFEVPHIFEMILCRLPHRDLLNCRLVSKAWDTEASKHVWKSQPICKVQCRLLRRKKGVDGVIDAVRKGKGLFRISKERKLLNVLSTSRSGNLLLKLKFDNATKIILQNYKSAVHVTKRSYFLHRCIEIDKLIHGFLSNPVMCNFVGSVKLDDCGDLDSILRMMTELPRLKEFNVKLDIELFLNTQMIIPKMYETSPIRRLVVDLDRFKWTEMESIKGKVRRGLKAILGICSELKFLHLGLQGCFFKELGFKVLNDSLKNPGQLERFYLKFIPSKVHFESPDSVSHLSPFTALNLMALYVSSEWKQGGKILNESLPPWIERLSIVNYIDKRPTQLKFEKLGKLPSLSNLNSYNVQARKSDKERNHWSEKWKRIDANMELVEAVTSSSHDQKRNADFRKYIHLKLLVLKFTENFDIVEEALRGVPKTVRILVVDSTNAATGMNVDTNLFRSWEKELECLNDLQVLCIAFPFEDCLEITETVKRLLDKLTNLHTVWVNGRRYDKENLSAKLEESAKKAKMEETTTSSIGID